MGIERVRFALDEAQSERVAAWLKSHDCRFSRGAYTGAIGGVVTYTFTPTSLGVVERAECACGQILDVTKYEEW